MAATNISLVIKDHADDTLQDLIAERKQLLERLYDVQQRIGLIEQHKMIEELACAGTRDRPTSESGQS